MNTMLLELRDGFDERIMTVGQRFKLEQSGDEFDAILTPVPSIDPTFELGSDLREKATLEIRRDRTPVVNYGDVVIQTQPFWATDALASPPRWKVIHREDNPANFVVKYWVAKITDQDVSN